MNFDSWMCYNIKMELKHTIILQLTYLFLRLQLIENVSVICDVIATGLLQNRTLEIQLWLLLIEINFKQKQETQNYLNV